MYDIVIIGAGAAGLTASIYARRAEKNTLVLEAMSYGLPCISFDSSSGSRELLKNSIGILITKRNKAQFAGAILKLLEDKNLLKEYSNRSLKKSLEYKNILGNARFMQVCKEQEEYFRTKCIVEYNVHTDSEGVTYNSIIELE